MDARHVLLLTATVAPGEETPVLALRDPEQREAQYLNALERWCEALGPEWDVVVAENSGWPASRFTAVGERVGRSVQVLECRDRGSAAGKGVGEAGLVDDFLASDLARGRAWIFKCTGRLFVRNLPACLPPLAGADGVCAAIVPSLDHMDSRFCGASGEVFQRYFAGMGDEIEEGGGIFFEHIAARRMLAAIAAGHPFQRFPVLPHVTGTSASLGTEYDSAGGQLKTLLRERLRRTVTEREILI